MKDWDFDAWILGEPASAKNQRRIVSIQNKPRLIKSKKALDYCKAFALQAKPLDPLIETDVSIRIDAFYASRRPDLACLDIIMDLLQSVVYLNDRQVKAAQVFWNLDRENPRVRIRVRKIPVDCSTGTSLYKPSTIWGTTESMSENQ